MFGLDLHKVFSKDNGDIGTLVFQPYLTRLDDVVNPSFFFDNGNDRELIWRIANFNYKVLNNGKFNFRVGHFEVPFGLEQNIDTNGTLRQYTFADRGIKADWGLSVNGATRSADYEIALTRGAGNTLEDTDNPYIFSGRVGFPSHRNFILGGSWFYGRVLAGEETVRRKKLGVDLAYYHRHFEWLFELSAGKNDLNNTVSTLAEMSYRDASEHFHGYIQFRHQGIKSGGWESEQVWTLGGSWQPSNHWGVSMQYARQVNSIAEKAPVKRLTAQVRYRF
ncbi:hypothetical protein SG34_032110 [Thalassomonas viridans]|uniref:Porin n=1 Tax=Thalassomonas viridans TaxID=137584 RepID=A0AAE9Z9P0_9GAMM|nr:hypothetical protein [Thalassomonas viridans]WDE08569.1 hypothetical protein SG34_032110 [Thalassomonas viridans]